MLEHVSTQHTPFDSAEVTNPVQAIRALEGRLDRGWDVISAKDQKGESTDALFRHFLGLLRQYEDLCDTYLIA
jgi:hypothetical protein